MGELARHCATIEALLPYPELEAFVGWVKTPPEDFFARTRKRLRIRNRNREPEPNRNRIYRRT